MPLSINVGLSRKASRNYQSSGVSINVTAELDQALLGRPAELQQKIGALYAQAQAALDQQIQHAGQRGQIETADARTNTSRLRSDNGQRAGETTTTRRPSSNTSPATASQKRAISAIAERAGVDAAREARQLTGTELSDLTVRQASQLIDHLKSLQPVGEHNGR